MLKDKFLTRVTVSDLYGFYVIHMIGDPDYELFPDEERSEELEKKEFQVIVTTGEALKTLQNLIIRFARVELGMDPVDLFFPQNQVIYKNTLDNLSRLAGNVELNDTIGESVEDLPEYASQYETLETLTGVINTMFRKEGIELSLLNEYFSGGGK